MTTNVMPHMEPTENSTTLVAATKAPANHAGNGATHAMDNAHSITIDLNQVSEQRRRELADFLRTRREKLKPESVGLSQSVRRRTPGLRREEVAELAGVGTTWYTWLEQARDIQPSAEVLRRLGQALRLTPAELRHMFSLAGKALPPELDQQEETVTENLERLLEHGIQVPAILLSSSWDVLSMNTKARTEFWRLNEEAYRNWVYFILCATDPRAKIASWEQNAKRLVAEFRASVSESLENPAVQKLIATLKKECPNFETWWREHDVRENAATVVEYTDDQGQLRRLERTVLKPSQNPRFRILVFTPVEA